MNSIQVLIDENAKLKFYLTGSSARKIKKGKANLLPGRLLTYELAPLTNNEIGKGWNENKAIMFGFYP